MPKQPTIADASPEVRRVLERHDLVMSVMTPVARVLIEQADEGVVPVSAGAYLLAQKSFPLRLPLILPPDNLSSPELRFTERPWAEAAVRSAARLALFDSALTDGQQIRAMAQSLRAINGDVRLDLVTIWEAVAPSSALAQEFTSYYVASNLPEL